MPRMHKTKNFIRKRIESPSKFDKNSFRTKEISKHTKIIVACPKGKFKRGKCAVGTRVQAILRKR